MLTAKYIRFLIYIYIYKQQGLFSKQLEGFVDLSALHKNVVKMLSLNMGEVYVYLHFACLVLLIS